LIHNLFRKEGKIFKDFDKNLRRFLKRPKIWLISIIKMVQLNLGKKEYLKIFFAL